MLGSSQAGIQTKAGKYDVSVLWWHLLFRLSDRQKAKQNVLTIHAEQIQWPLQRAFSNSTRILTGQSQPPQQRPKGSLDTLLADKPSVSLLTSLTPHYGSEAKWSKVMAKEQSRLNVTCLEVVWLWTGHGPQHCSGFLTSIETDKMIMVVSLEQVPTTCQAQGQAFSMHLTENTVIITL